MRSTTVAIVSVIILTFLACNNAKNHGEDSSSDAKYQKYISDRLNIAIEIPKNWKVEADSGNTLVSKEGCTADAVFCSNLVIMSVDNVDSLTIDQLVSVYTQYIERKFGSFKLLAIQDVEVANVKSKIIDYKLFENNTHLGSTTVLMISGGRILSFDFSAENKPEGGYVKHRKNFLKMLNSVELLEPKRD